MSNPWLSDSHKNYDNRFRNMWEYVQLYIFVKMVASLSRADHLSQKISRLGMCRLAVYLLCDLGMSLNLSESRFSLR